VLKCHIIPTRTAREEFLNYFEQADTSTYNKGGYKAFKPTDNYRLANHVLNDHSSVLLRQKVFDLLSNLTRPGCIYIHHLDESFLRMGLPVVSQMVMVTSIITEKS